MTTPERIARAYCLEIGADPDAPVWGYFRDVEERAQAPRWCWYVAETPGGRRDYPAR